MSYCRECGLDMAREDECLVCGNCLDCCECEGGFDADELGIDPEAEDEIEFERRQRG